MNGKCAGITDLMDGDSDRLDAVAVILLAAGLECKCCPSLQCSGRGSGEGGGFWTGSITFLPPPPRDTIRSKLLSVSCAELTPSHPQPVLQVLPAARTSLLAAAPHDCAPLFFLSPNTLLPPPPAFSLLLPCTVL